MKKTILFIALALLCANVSKVNIKAEENEMQQNMDLSFKDGKSCIIFKGIYSKKYNCYFTTGEYLTLLKHPILSKYLIIKNILGKRHMIAWKPAAVNVLTKNELQKYSFMLPNNYKQRLIQNKCIAKNKVQRIKILYDNDNKLTMYLDVEFDCE